MHRDGLLQTRSFKEGIASFFDWFLCNRLKSDEDTETLGRGRLLVAFSFFLMLWGPVFTVVFYAGLGSRAGAIAISAATLLVLAALILLRYTGRILLASIVVATVLFCLLLYLACITGGLWSPAVMWDLAVPMVAMCLAGRRWGVLFGALVLLEIIGFGLCELVGHPFKHEFSRGPMTFLLLTDLVGITLVVISLVLILHVAHERAQAGLRRRSVQLSEAIESLGKEIADRKRAAKHLKDLVETAPDAVVIVDEDGRIALVNALTEALFGYARRELLGKPVELLLPERLHARHRELRAGYAASPAVRPMGSGLELCGLRKDGAEFPAEISLSPLRTDEGWLISSSIRDVTQRKRGEEAMRRANRGLAARSQCSQALIQSKSEPELLNRVCEILVATGGYRLAWVGLAEQDEGKSVRPVAQSGLEDGYLDTVSITYADTERGRGPTGTAIRSGEPSLSRRIPDDPTFAPWRDDATRRGYASSIALPLKDSGQTFGALNIYASNPDAFDEDETTLLVDLANDVAFGLVALRTHNDRKRVQEQLQRRNAELRAINEVFQSALAFDTEEKLARNGLVVAEKVTGAAFGFIGEINAAGRVDALALSDPGWAGCAMSGTDTDSALRNMEIRGIWGEVLRKRRSLIVNDLASHPARVGTPDGHPRLTNFLGVPLEHAGETFGMIALANKKAGFNADDLESIEALSVAIVHALMRRRADRALQVSEQRYRHLFEELNDAAFLADIRTGRIIETNHRAEILLGRTRDEILGMHQSELHPSGEAERYRQVFATHIAQEACDDCDAEVVRADGERVPVTISTSTLTVGQDRLMLGLFRNIAERKEAEKRLRESQRVLVTLMGNLPGMAYRCRNDRRWTMEFASEGCHTLTGYEPQDLIDNSTLAFADLIHPDDRDAVWATVQGAVAQKQPFDMQYRITTADGVEKWVSERGRPVFTQAGELVALEGFLSDVTAERQAKETLRTAHTRLEHAVRERTSALELANEQLVRECQEREMAQHALRESEHRLQSILDHAPAVIYLKDREGRYLLINRLYEQLLRVNRKDVVGRTDGELFPPETASALRANDQKVLQEGRALQFEEHVRHEDGTHSYVSVRFPLFDGGDEPYAICGISTDITDRKQMERMLQASEERLRRAVSDAPFPIIIHAEDGEVILANKTLTELTGYEPEAIPTISDWTLKAYGAESNKVQARIDRLYEIDSRVADGEFVVTTSSGERQIWDFSSAPLGLLPDGRRLVISMASDVTRYKQVERELEQARKSAEAASKAKSEFLASMSHELRTPLNGVIGMLELLLRAKLDPQQRRYAWLAKTSGDLLLNLINDILDFSKIEAGKLELETIDFDLQYTVESTVVSLASRAQGKGLELVCSIHPDVPTLLRGDPGRLQQVLMNLITNAIKFTEQGEVVVRVTKEEEIPRRATIRCTVTDTGIGIPPDRVESMFDSFTQADASTTRKYGGTGLGLAICKQIIGLMSGQIGVESEPGRGSTFWFTVTLEKQPTGEPPPHTVLGDIRHLRVLAVDDNATNREILREQLTGLGVSNETAPDGERALTMLRDAAGGGAPFGLAILDMQMPQMDGEELARAIKADPAIEGTILMLLTSGYDCDPEHLRSLGFAGWLTKPVRRLELLDAIVEATVCATAAPHRMDHDIDEQASASAHSVRAARAAETRILLAEDNEISQEAAAELLRRAGYQCDVAGDGKEAVEAALAQDYDLILMDCQMPELDGFDATRTIRRHEEEGTLSSRQGRRIPIVALTANAIKGDRDRCLEAGMDDYVSKPLDPDRLVQVIESHLRGNREPQEEPSRPSEDRPNTDRRLDATVDNLPGPDASTPFDIDTLLKRWGNDREFAGQLIAKFVKRAPDDLEALRQAVMVGDVKEATRLAHGLKGAAGYVAAEKVREIAAKLETMGRDGDLSDAEACLMQLQSELARCMESAPQALLEAANALHSS